MTVTKARTVGTVGIVFALAAALIGVAMTGANAQQRYFILIGGTCDGDASAYQDAWLAGGIKRVVHYPAGAAGLPDCDQTPMDQSVARGHEEARRVVQASYNEDPSAEFVVVGYSQGAIVANKVLNDIADGDLAVDKSRFRAKLYADPMQPVGPPGRGISAVIPEGVGAPSPFGGYVSFGPGRTDFGGIPFIRYCIDTDGVCHFDTPEAAGGYVAQHTCYQWPRPNDHRSIMQDSIADGVYINGSHRLPRQDCGLG